MRRSRLSLALTSCLAVAGCGLPDPPDIKGKWHDAVQGLGLYAAVYPPRETIRLGQLWIVDISSADKSNPKPKPGRVVTLPLSNTLVEAMETARANQYPLLHRVAAGGGPNLATALASKSGTAAAAQQADKDTFELSAIPGYNLASVDQASLAGTLPTPFATLLGAIGFTQSKSMTMEAKGVEIADMPVDSFGDTLRKACAPGGPLGNAAVRDYLHTRGWHDLYPGYKLRQQDAGTTKIAPFRPSVLLVRRVWYMRGINYVFSDDKAAAAALTAAINTRLAATASPPAVLGLPDLKGVAAADLPKLAALLNEINAQLANASPAGTTAGIRASVSRATSQGITFTEAFDRPLAFAYDAIAREIKVDDSGRSSGGLSDICNEYAGPSPT